MNLLTNRRETKKREKENLTIRDLAISKISKARWGQVPLKT
jgi:hypothetical protein